jgi:hypothetical protein
MMSDLIVAHDRATTMKNAASTCCTVLFACRGLSQKCVVRKKPQSRGHTSWGPWSCGRGEESGA